MLVRLPVACCCCVYPNWKRCCNTAVASRWAWSLRGPHFAKKSNASRGWCLRKWVSSAMQSLRLRGCRFTGFMKAVELTKKLPRNRASK